MSMYMLQLEKFSRF